MDFDTTDRRLLNFLQEDAKQTTKELAYKLNLSVTAVYERIKKLEKHQVISRYVALVNKEMIGKNFVVLCHVKLMQHSKEYILQFEKEIDNLEEVTECFHVSGDYDYILKICMENMQKYRDFMVTKLTTLKHIGSTHSSFVIAEVKNSTGITV